MIQFNNVSKAYLGGRPALQGINFDIARGEMVFLTGHSGAGKSTLLKLICGLERPSNGAILFANKNVGKLNKYQLPFLRRQIGMVFQDHQLLMDHTIFDNVALPLIISGKKQPEIQSRVNAALDKVRLLDKKHCYPIQLSGGEQQRVGIARAIVNKPAVLLADEPTGNLDQELSRGILRLFEEFNKTGVTVLIATHNLELVMSRNYRTINLYQGRVAQEFNHVS